MRRRARLLAGAAWLAALLTVPVGVIAQSQREAVSNRTRLWEPRDVRRALGTAFGDVNVPPPAAAAPTLPSAFGGTVGITEAPLEPPGAPAVAATPPPAGPATPAPATQTPATTQPGRPTAPDRNAPVTFTAESISYDEPSETVTAVGRVEAWQNDRVLQADRVTFDRRTGIARAEGNVVLLEPDGQVLFAERAELNQDFSAGVAQGMRGLLADNGRMAATAARRRDGRLTEMYRGVYTTCDPCERDPQRAPLWQIRARRAQHDQELKRLEYWGPTLQMAGIPILYLPYLSHPDPTVKRSSGLLPPLFGRTEYLGQIASIPYYGVIDDQSDFTVEPILTTSQGGVLAGEYRRRFDTGYLTFRGSGTRDSENAWRGHILGASRVALNDTWTTGFNLARVSDISYLRNYRFGSPAYLTTRPFVEGFWPRSYALLDASAYQGLSSVDAFIASPVVLPRTLFAYNGPAGRYGGRFSFDFGNFAIWRNGGTDTQRYGGRASWSSEFIDGIGSRWTVGTRLDMYGYNFSDYQLGTNRITSGTAGVALPQLFGMWRLPLHRRYGSTTHVIEPIIQAIGATSPGVGGYPNEDSRDLEFTDANLFSLNRFPGRDRLEGGVRMNYGLRNTLFLENGGNLEVIFGQSLRTQADPVYGPQSGLAGRSSDYVARFSIDPVPWLGIAYRTRFASDQWRQTFTDLSAYVTQGPLAAVASYILVPPSVQAFRPVRREEVGGVLYGGPFANTPLDRWRGFGGAYYNVEQSRFVSTLFGLIYEDECFVFDVRYVRAYTNPALQAAGGTTVLFNLVFKTVGDFGFSAF